MLPALNGEHTILAAIEQELARRIRAWITMAEQASSEGDRRTTELHKTRAETLHTFGLWLSDYVKRP